MGHVKNTWASLLQDKVQVLGLILRLSGCSPLPLQHHLPSLDPISQPYQTVQHTIRRVCCFFFFYLFDFTYAVPSAMNFILLLHIVHPCNFYLTFFCLAQIQTPSRSFPEIPISQCGAMCPFLDFMSPLSQLKYSTVIKRVGSLKPNCLVS